MTKTDKSSAFLQAMEISKTPSPQSQPKPRRVEVEKGNSAKPRATSTRHGLKHIGGYFNREDVEKFAVLRARLQLDNSELIKLAVEDLYKKNRAKRAFGDA